MEKQVQTAGSLKISQDVLSAIAKYAACEIEGVEALAESRLPRSLSKNGITTKPIAIELNDDVAVVDIGVILKNGAKIPEVSEVLQKAIKDAVQNMTGITVSKVNVHVENIVFEEAKAE